MLLLLFDMTSPFGSLPLFIGDILSLFSFPCPFIISLFETLFSMGLLFSSISTNNNFLF
jgi:hypothetical protein